ncbi:transposon Tf2-9 polyprotein [Trichonephila clavipes]|nr:transposon Tf2-9 polyprotein [Trichonephila clavipes]
MTTVDFLHHENPPIWAGVEPATLGADGQRQTNYATQSALAEFPHYSPSNGMVEKAVGISKSIMKKAREDRRDYLVGLMECRNTRISGLDISPAQMMFNRRLKTKLPISNKLLNAELFNNIREKLIKRQNVQKIHYDKTAHPLPERDPEDNWKGEAKPICKQHKWDSRFGRRGDMTSTPNWSDMTDSTDKSATITTGLGASPSQTIIGDDHIAENSDVFREAIQARNIYTAWARKLTNAKPSDPDVQLYHQEVKKAGETVENLLIKLNVPLFKIPASEKELDRIVFRVKNKPAVPTPSKNQEAEKPAAVPPPPSNSPRKGRKGKRSVDSEGFAPPKKLVRKARSPRLSPPPSPTPPSATSVEDARLEGEEEEMDSSQPAELQDQVVVPEMSGRFPEGDCRRRARIQEPQPLARTDWG